MPSADVVADSTESEQAEKPVAALVKYLNERKTRDKSKVRAFPPPRLVHVVLRSRLTNASLRQWDRHRGSWVKGTRTPPVVAKGLARRRFVVDVEAALMRARH